MFRWDNASRRLRVTLGTDCSGIDAPRFALAGIGDVDCDYLFASDIDPVIQRVLKTPNPHHATPERVFGDVLQRADGEAPPVAIYVAGFPCQAFSSMGKQRGMEDARGTVFDGIFAYLRSARPATFVLENVQGLLSHDKGATWRHVHGALQSLGEYSVEHKVISPVDIGFPQSRRRVFIVGRSRRLLGEAIADRPFRWPEPREVAANALDGVLQHEEDIGPSHSVRRPLSSSAARTLDAVASHPDVVQAGGAERLHRGIMLQMSRGRERLPSVEGASCCLTLDSSKIYLMHRGRYITSTEALRLQGFPDDAVPGFAAPHKVYRMAGNSMCVPVVESILRELTGALREAAMQ